MTIRLDAATALLVELLRGPGYGLELIERIRRHGPGFTPIPQGVVYPALGRLERRGLLRGWNVANPGSGRPRTYYELTLRGLPLALSRRESLAGFCFGASGKAPAAPDPARMAEGLAECFRISEFAAALARAGKARPE